MQRTLPGRLVASPNIFAGQLFYSCRQDYRDVCDLLGLAADGEQDGSTIEADGLIRCDFLGRVGGSSGLTASPVAPIKDLAKLWRDGESIVGSHAAIVFDGGVLAIRGFQENDRET